MQWFLKLKEVLLNKIGFIQLKSDTAVFVKHIRAKPVFVTAYVDDLVHLSIFSDLLDKGIGSVLAHFDRKSESLEWYLGVHFQIFQNNFSILQESYPKQGLQVFAYEDIKNHSTPMVLNFFDVLSHHNDDKIVDGTEY